MKSFVALLVCSLALSAFTQSTGCLTVASGTFNASFLPSAVSTLVSSACVQCAGGFSVNGGMPGTTACTACVTGCAWCANATYCYVAAAGYYINTTASTTTT